MSIRLPKPNFRRHRHAVLDVAVALAEHLQIDGEHQRAAFGRRGARHQFADKAAVAHDVELEPERLVDRRGDVLDRADRHGRQRERNAGRLRGAAGENFAVAVLHAAQPDRRQDQRQRRRLAEDGGRGRARGNVDQDALAQLDGFEIGAVGAQRLLGIGAAVGIFEERPRHLAAGGLPQVLDAGHGFHGVRIPALSASLIAQSPAVSGGLNGTEPPDLAGGYRMTRSRERGRVPAVGIGKNEENGPIQASSPPCPMMRFRGRGGHQAPPRAGGEPQEEARRSAGSWPRGYLSRFRPGLGHPAAAEPVRQGQPLKARTPGCSGRHAAISVALW